MKKILVGMTIIAATACNISTSEKTTGSDSSVVVTDTDRNNPVNPTTPSADMENCFRYVAQRDTYDIRLTKTGNEVSGSMHFNNYQKDDSRGNFTGSVVKDNIIKVIYKFESEGMHSTRELFLKDTNNELITGIGEEDVKGDSAFIKNPDAVSFTGAVYKKVDRSGLK